MVRQLPPVDDDVFEALQQLAEPLVDDINSVLRRLLKLHAEQPPREPTNGAGASPARPLRHDAVAAPEPTRTTASRSQRSSRKPNTKKRPAARPRAARGTLLPEQEYEIPLLRALENHSGSAAASEIIEAVGRSLETRLTEADREVLDSGLTRWKNRVQFVRLKLVQAGQMKKDSPRGIWEITPAGSDRLRDLGSSE